MTTRDRVVLVSFPFDDLPAAKVRPAVGGEARGRVEGRVARRQGQERVILPRVRRITVCDWWWLAAEWPSGNAPMV